MKTLKVKRVTQTAIIPQKAHQTDAGFDLYSDTDAVIRGGETCMIHTGIAVEIPDGCFGGIYARSGLAKKGLRPSNCVGVVDQDYRGEVLVGLHNDSDEEFRVRVGDRVAQLVIHKIPSIQIEEVDDLSATERGTGGHGSTGR